MKNTRYHQLVPQVTAHLNGLDQAGSVDALPQVMRTTVRRAFCLANLCPKEALRNVEIMPTDARARLIEERESSEKE